MSQSLPALTQTKHHPFCAVHDDASDTCVSEIRDIPDTEIHVWAEARPGRPARIKLVGFDAIVIPEVLDHAVRVFADLRATIGGAA